MRSLILGLSVGGLEKKKRQNKNGEVSNKESQYLGIITSGAWKWQDVVKIKREQRKRW